MDCAHSSDRLDAFLDFAAADSDRSFGRYCAVVRKKKIRAAVLVPFWRQEDGWQIVLTRRSADLAHHSGQISFPGGKIESGEDTVAAALRETYEEIGIGADNITVGGILPELQTLTGFAVTPVCAQIHSADWRAQPGEVAEIFTVPAALALDTSAYLRSKRRIFGVVPFYSLRLPFAAYDIWGATALILYRLAQSHARFTAAEGKI